MSYGNEPTRPPDHQGAGRAWRIQHDVEPDVPDHQAGVGSWLVYAPYGHPLWYWYCVGGVHLRPIEGVKPATIQFPGATHEILFCALSPERPLPSLDDWKEAAFLQPLDLTHQFIVPDDIAAAELTELVVRHIVAGNSPDQDYRSYWRDVIDKTAEHQRLGKHPG